MVLLRLELAHFRSYTRRLFTFSPGITVIVGPNTAGKTNLMEAIYLLARGGSFRAQTIEEMVAWGAEVGRIEGEILRFSGNSHVARSTQDDKLALESLASLSNEKVELEVVLTRGVVQGEVAAKRKLLVNKVARRSMDFVGNLAVVVFRPEDLELIGGSPSVRRGYLNSVLSQVDREYQRSLVSYEKALRRRNKLLDLIREGEATRTALTFWDQVVVKDGTYLTTKRREFVEFINAIREERGFRVVYDFSAISERRLQEYSREEVAAGYTLVGPHKDDFLVEGKGQAEQDEQWRDLAVFGSRGEQRMAVLWLKLNELLFMAEKKGERPILLLDDIFSELDEEHRDEVWRWCGEQQTIVTVTSEEALKKQNDLRLIRLP